jgi:hypothetical protein
MSALPSQLTITPGAAPSRIESAKSHAMQPSLILLAIGEQVRALFLAQQSLAGRFLDAAYAAEDDYRRFSNRSC